MPHPPAPDPVYLYLHEFLHEEQTGILNDWQRKCKFHLEATRDLSDKEHLNGVPAMLTAIAEEAQRAVDTDLFVELPQKAAKIHAEHRWNLGVTLEELTIEYLLLRAVTLERLLACHIELAKGELVFLNKALDEVIIAGVKTYVAIANQALTDERERLQVTLSSIADGVISTDSEGYIRYANPAAEQIIGWPQKDAMGRHITTVLIAIDEHTRESLKCLSQIAKEQGEMAQHPDEILLQRRNGDLVPAEEVAAPLWDPKGEFMGVVITFRDVSKLRDLTSQLGYLAAHDPLTGLPNRSLLSDRLAQEVAHAERNNNRLALLYLDLDLFKNVNDSLGHSAGDDLLKQVAERLKACVRRSDTVCRVGGDEFVILLTEFAGTQYLSELGESIIKQLGVPYRLGAHSVDMSASVGISVYPDDGVEPETMIRHADIAMYLAKESGRNNVQFFAQTMNDRAAERRVLQGDLRKALAGGQLSLRFQPQIALGSGWLVGAEVLLRWRHPRLGLVSPSQFIPVAEDCRDIMLDIGDWVLEEACRQARAWLDAGYAALRVSVNVSLVQLRSEHFLAQVADVLARFRLPAAQLQLELTESVLMSDFAGANARIRALEAMGVRIAVDDFGTGYSSLSNLKDLAVNEIKIDQSFMHDLNLNSDKAAIVQAVIRMGQSLNLRVIAEGVENQAAVEFLTSNGCEGAQGYYYSKAIAAGAFERRFMNRLH